MRKANIWMAVVLIVFGGLVVADSLRLGIGWSAMGPQAGFFPFLMGAGIVICSIIVFFKGIQTLKKEGPGKPLIPKGGLKPILWVLLPSTGMVALIAIFGIHVSALIFLVFYMRVVGKINLAIVIPVSIIVPLIVYSLFEKVFMIPLPAGLLGSAIMSPWDMIIDKIL